MLLREEGGTRSLPIWIGAQEAASIASALEDEVPPRPMTHDLLAAVLTLIDPVDGWS
nr:bifunctional nuclease domain-containing protein [Tessaracoccus coleopterorum]